MLKPTRYQLPLSEALEEMEKAGRRWGHRVRRVVAGIGYTTLALAFATCLTVITILRFYGLPTVIRDYVLKQVEALNIYVSVDKLLLDPTGGIVAERVSLFSNSDRVDLICQVDRVRIGIAWFSWWQGKPFLESFSVANAKVRYPITKKTFIEMSQVGGTVEIEEGGYRVRRALGRFLNLQLDLKGFIGRAPVVKNARKSELSLEQMERIDRFWPKILAASDDLDTGNPIRVQVEFNVPMAHPDQASIHALIGAQMFRWRGALIDEVTMQASLEQGQGRLTELRLKGDRGELLLSGEASLLEKTARLDLTSDLDFTELLTAAGGQLQKAVRQLSFTELPICNAQLSLGWKDPTPSINLQAKIDWTHFTYGRTYFDHLSLPVAYDGNRLFVADAELAASDGMVKAEFLYDRSKPEINGWLTSNLDPTVFKGAFGERADLFLDSLQFFKGGPNLKLKVAGQSNDFKQWLLTGSFAAQDFSYKKVAIDSLQTDLSFQNMEVDVPNLIVKRKEGQLTGEVRENFLKRWVRITNLHANLLIQEADVVLGDKFVSYVDKYVLDRPPTLRVDGVVDLNDRKDNLDTDLRVEVSGQTDLSYLLFKKNFVIANPVGEITIKNRDLNIKIQDGRMFDGPVSGNIFVKLVKDPLKEVSDFSVKLGLKNADFKEMMTALFNNEKTSGKFDLNTEMTGKIGDLSTITGNGDMHVIDGYLMNIPVLSGMTFIVDNIIPGFGLSKVDEARATFILGAGALTTKDLVMNSAIFSISGNGDYSYVQDQLNMDMRVNVRGVIGWITTLVSKIFQYHGKGPLGNVIWAPKILGG